MTQKTLYSSSLPKHPESTELREVMLRLGITINEFMREYPQVREIIREKCNAND